MDDRVEIFSRGRKNRADEGISAKSDESRVSSEIGKAERGRNGPLPRAFLAVKITCRSCIRNARCYATVGDIASGGDAWLEETISAAGQNANRFTGREPVFRPDAIQYSTARDSSRG